MLQVYRKRDDLPMLTMPLVLLIVFTAAGCTAAAAAVMRDGLHDGLNAYGIPGFFAALPLLCLSVAAYGILIILWRRAVSMVVTVLSAIAVYAISGLLVSTAICLSVYVCAYVYASSFLLCASRYRRIVSLTASAAICLFVAGLLFTGFVWKGVPITDLPRRIADSLAGLFENSAFFAMTAENAAAAARSVTISLPALWLMTAEAAAWICEWICHRLFHLMECERYFLPEADEGITTPRYFGAIVMILSFLLLATSYRKNPLLYAALSNCVFALFPPAVYVGLHEAALRIRDRLADAYIIGRGHRTRTVVIIILLLVWSMAVLGGGTVCFVFAVYGAWRVVRNHPDTKTDGTA